MKILKPMAAATAFLITLLACCSRSEPPQVSNPENAINYATTALVIEEKGYLNSNSYTIVKDKVSGVRFITFYQGGAMALEKPQPLEGH